MQALGHPGITLGIAVLLAGVSNRWCSPTRERGVAGGLQSGPVVLRISNWLDHLAKRIDIRLLLIASLLPDIIDKPTGHLFFRETFSNGRIFNHTLVFLLLVAMVGLFLYRRAGKTWLLVLSFGTATHVILDRMWSTPRTLLWPAYGLAFDRGDVTNWIPGMLHALVTDARVFVPELVGATILAWFAVVLVRRKRVFAFVKHGRVS